jgi:hypothetical protein
LWEKKNKFQQVFRLGMAASTIVAAPLEMLGQGAEAKVWKSTFCGKPCVS